MKPDWRPWVLGAYFPPDCGGHSYMHSDMQANDIKRSAEKAYRSGGKWQVVHFHEQGNPCVDGLKIIHKSRQCVAYGTEVEVPKRG